MPLLSLPPELICRVAYFLPRDKDRLSLIRVNHSLHNITIPELYNTDEYCVRKPLSWLTKTGHQQGIQHLLSRNVNMNTVVQFHCEHLANYRVIHVGTPLLIAIEHGQSHTVEFLLRNGANPNFGTDVTPLELAAMMGDSQTTRTLLQSGASVNHAGQAGQTPLTQAVEFEYMHRVEGSRVEKFLRRSDNEIDHLTVIQLLLDFEADPNPMDINSVPLLCYLAKKLKSRDTTVMKKLLDHGADVKSKSTDGNTPLHESVSPDHDYPSSEFIRLLLKHGADVNAPNDLGQTPLHVAVFNPSQWTNGFPSADEGMEMLIRHGADIDWRDNQENTPFHLAVECPAEVLIERCDVLKPLLEAGGDVYCKEKTGATLIYDILGLCIDPYGWKFDETKRVIALLMTHGAQPDLQLARERCPRDELTAPYRFLTALMRKREIPRKTLPTRKCTKR